MSDAAPAFSYYNHAVTAWTARDILIVLGQEGIMTVVAKAQYILFAFPLVLFLAPFLADPQDDQSKHPRKNIYDKTS